MKRQHNATGENFAAGSFKPSKMILVLLWAITFSLLLYSYFGWRGFVSAAGREAAQRGVPRKATATAPARPAKSTEATNEMESGEAREKAAREAWLTLAVAATDVGLDEVYQDLFSILNLDPGKYGALRSLLLKRQSAVERMLQEERRNGSADDPSQWEVLVAAVSASFDGEFRELLGDANVSLTKDYFDTAWLRMYTRRFEKLVNADALTLSVSAREKLVTSLAKANPVRTVYPSVPEETTMEAASFLSPREFAAFQSLALEMNGYAKSYEEARKIMDAEAVPSL